MGIQGQSLFMTLAQGHVHIKIKTGFSQKQLGLFNKILYVSFHVKGYEDLIIKYDVCHMTKMVTMSIYFVNTL